MRLDELLDQVKAYHVIDGDPVRLMVEAWEAERCVWTRDLRASHTSCGQASNLRILDSELAKYCPYCRREIDKR